jgi:hypothetical protein
MKYWNPCGINLLQALRVPLPRREFILPSPLSYAFASFTEVAALQAILTAADNHDEPDLAAVVALGESENQSTTALFLNNNDGPTLELILKSS